MTETAIYDYQKLAAEYTYDQILAGARCHLGLSDEVGDELVFAYAHRKYYSVSGELTHEDYSRFATQAERCRMGEEKLPICVFVQAIDHYFGCHAL